MGEAAKAHWVAIVGFVVFSNLWFFASPALPDEIAAAASTAATSGAESGSERPAAETSSNLSVFRNTQTYVQSYVEYNPSTCAFIESGTTKAVTPPKYGKLTFGTASLKATSAAGPCKGMVYPFSIAYYTWTDTKPAETQDTFSLEWTTSDGLFDVNTSWNVTLGPRIYFNGTDVTDTTQEVALGQMIALTTAPTETGQTQSWTGGLAKTVGGYTYGTKGAVTRADFSKSSTTFFWTTLGTKSVTYEETTSHGKGSATAKFEVQGPTSPLVTAKLGAVQVISNNSLSFGNVDTARAPGITFTETAGASPQAGQFEWAQLLNSDLFLLYPSGGKLTTCSFGAGLDNIFPYPMDTGGTANDSPGTNLQTTWSKAFQENRFQMFLMWQSDTTGSIPVPLGSVHWFWSGTAARNAKTGVWSLQAGSTKGATAFGASSDFPVWSQVVANGARTCH